MSLRSLPPDGETRNSASSHITPQLEARHRKILVEGSGIDPGVIAERGVRTVAKGRELPPVYSRRQKKRAPGILFTLHRPNGEPATIFRPDEPDPENPGHKYEQQPKYTWDNAKREWVRTGPGNVLDVHPSLHPLIEEKGVPVVFVEGVKKADAITSAAQKAKTDLVVVAISGVWNWMTDKEPISDMFDVPVKGRRTLICFDSDMVRKPEVQMAAEALALHLTRRGAELEVVYLEDQPDGSKTGADDFLTNVGTLGEMLALARPYSPGDLHVERLRRDERLQAALGYLVSVYEELPVKASGQCTMRATFRTCLEMLEQRGKLVEGGIAAPIPSLDGAAKAAISQPTFSKRLKELEEMGLVRRIKPEKRDHSYRYLFRIPEGAIRYKDGGARGKSNTRYINVFRGYKLLPPLGEARWSTPEQGQKRRGVVEGTRKVRQGPTSGAASEGVRRPGKKRAEVVRYVAAAGGAATRDELLGRFGTERTIWRDFKKKVLADLLGARRQHQGAPLSVGPPVLELTDEGVRLVDGWEAAWEHHRSLGREQEAADRQERDNVRKRISYRRRNETPADPAPTEEEMAEGREARQKCHRAARLVKEGMAAHIVREEVLGADGWIEDLGPVEDVPPPLGREEHPLDCECPGCVVTAPRYVRLAR